MGGRPVHAGGPGCALDQSTGDLRHRVNRWAARVTSCSGSTVLPAEQKEDADMSFMTRPRALTALCTLAAASAAPAHAEHILLARQVEVPHVVAAFLSADPRSDWVAIPMKVAPEAVDGPAVAVDLTCGVYSARLTDAGVLKTQPFASAVDGSLTVYGIDPDEIDYTGALENTGIDPDEIDYTGALENTGIDPDEIDVTCADGGDNGLLRTDGVAPVFKLMATEIIYVAVAADGSAYVLHNRSGSTDG
jgi:hypothetical protein